MAEKLFGNRYRIQSKIGIGGMATVYRGTDTVLGRPVAVKTMLPQYASDPSFAARFKQEAQAAAALQSPYIVGIFDWGEDNKTYYIVMEYLKGTDLKTGIRTHGALSSRKVAQIGSQICQALSVAHRHDIIHRDIKPQNIMVQPDGNIKVMDFGIARAKNSDLTQDNSVLGTAHYVSPEQTQGKQLGPTSDIYSLGIVMYEAATGTVPFKGEDAISVALKQVNEAPKPPSSINPNVDTQLEAIILKCLEKDPANRFQSAEQLRRALTDYLAGNKVVIPSADATTMMPAPQTTQLNRPPQQAGQNGANTGVLPKASLGQNTSLYGQPQKSSSKKKAAIIISILVAALLVTGVVLAFNFGLFGENPSNTSETTENITVPDLVGMDQSSAQNAITRLGLKVGNITIQSSDTVDQGKVMAQDPEGGSSAKKGDSVAITISSGKEPVKQVSVPDLSGMTETEARATLTALGLTAQMSSVQSDTVDSGKVARQTPAAGAQIDKGGTVTFYISTGAGSATVPDVTGYSQSNAIAALERAGFSASVDNQKYSDTIEKGCVVSYTPSGNQPKGTTVSLTISLGPKSSGGDSGSGGGSDSGSGGGGSDSGGGTDAGGVDSGSLQKMLYLKEPISGETRPRSSGERAPLS